MLMKVALAFGESALYIPAQLVFDRIVTDYEGSAKIRFPLLEHRPKVEKNDVIFLNGQVGRILVIRRQSIASGAHDAFMPVTGDSVFLGGKGIDGFVDFQF